MAFHTNGNSGSVSNFMHVVLTCSVSASSLLSFSTMCREEPCFHLPFLLLTQLLEIDAHFMKWRCECKNACVIIYTYKLCLPTHTHTQKYIAQKTHACITQARTHPPTHTHTHTYTHTHTLANIYVVLFIISVSLSLRLWVKIMNICMHAPPAVIQFWHCMSPCMHQLPTSPWYRE